MKTFTTTAAIEELTYKDGKVYYTKDHTIQASKPLDVFVIAIIKIKNKQK